MSLPHARQQAQASSSSSASARLHVVPVQCDHHPVATQRLVFVRFRRAPSDDSTDSCKGSITSRLPSHPRSNPGHPFHRILLTRSPVFSHDTSGEREETYKKDHGVATRVCIDIKTFESVSCRLLEFDLFILGSLIVVRHCQTLPKSPRHLRSYHIALEDRIATTIHAVATLPSAALRHRSFARKDIPRFDGTALETVAVVNPFQINSKINKLLSTGEREHVHAIIYLHLIDSNKLQESLSRPTFVLCMLIYTDRHHHNGAQT